MLRAVTQFISETCRTIVGLVSVVLVTVSAFTILVFVGLALSGASLSPYAGILAYMLLPGAFVLGLVGVAVSRARFRRALLRGEPLRGTLDLNNPRDRERLLAVTSLTGVNLLIMALVGYHGVHFMDSTTFCGKVCHQVMQPEYTAYQHSAHARVACTDCHIGPGASWFVKSKLSGTRQVFAVLFNTYGRPIPTPIENLRPARETCEECHWPAKFHGDRLKVLSRYQEDEPNTELKTVMVLKVGGGSVESGFGQGIHWHVASKVEYRASRDRKTIYWVRVQDAPGQSREYWAAGAEARKDSIMALPARRMDCIDCHNRPTHTYQLPDDEMDKAMKSGLISAALPYVKREGMRLLQHEWPSKDAALAACADSLRGFYARQYPQLATARAAAIDSAAAAVRDIYERNVFPAMHIGWGTYANMIGHRNDGGCFRCHDEQHTTADGKTISQDCATCHRLLAMEEPAPPIMQSLYGSSN
jgi:nitrate/TMAO reductase-like tetraheme cytochrome c subunit